MWFPKLKTQKMEKKTVEGKEVNRSGGAKMDIQRSVRCGYVSTTTTNVFSIHLHDCHDCILGDIRSM